MALERPSRRPAPLTVVVLGIIAAVLLGLVWLWSPAPADDQGPAAARMPATVTAIDPLPVDESGLDQVRVAFEVTGGAAAGRTTSVDTLVDQLPTIRPGDGIVVQAAGDGDDLYIVDLQRSTSLLALLALFVAVVVLVARWQGLRSLLGLAISLGLVTQFVVPAILAGRAPVPVALVGSAAVMVVTLLLAHGVSTRTNVAIVGTTVALAVTVGLAAVFIDWSAITGMASDDARFAQVAVEDLDLAGLVLAGLIIAALGVLDDVTVAQASTVWALHDTDPGLSSRHLFHSAMSVGRDHIASTVNTLVLAYAGASLTLLVAFSTSGRRTTEILTSEVVAAEVVKTLVGSLGLIAAVPLTTGLAALLVVRRTPTEVEASRRHRSRDADVADGHRH